MQFGCQHCSTHRPLVPATRLPSRKPSAASQPPVPTQRRGPSGGARTHTAAGAPCCVPRPSHCLSQPNARRWPQRIPGARTPHLARRCETCGAQHTPRQCAPARSPCAARLAGALRRQCRAPCVVRLLPVTTSYLSPLAPRQSRRTQRSASCKPSAGSASQCLACPPDHPRSKAAEKFTCAGRCVAGMGLVGPAGKLRTGQAGRRAAARRRSCGRGPCSGRPGLGGHGDVPSPGLGERGAAGGGGHVIHAT
jgi:hypothetical protein